VGEMPSSPAQAAGQARGLIAGPGGGGGGTGPASSLCPRPLVPRLARPRFATLLRRQSHALRYV